MTTSLMTIETTGVIEDGCHIALDDAVPVGSATHVRVMILVPDTSEPLRGTRHLMPMPELEGRVPDGWKDAVYGDA